MKKHLIFFLSCFLFTAHAYGFDFKGIQPLQPYAIFSTFSAETLKKGDFGVALGLERSSEPNFYRITGQFGAGITDKLEFLLSLPYVIDWNGSENGFEDISVALQYRLIDEGTYNPAVAFILGSSLNSGKDDFSTEGNIGGGIILTKRVGPFKGHLNLFYFKPFTNQLEDDVTFAAGIDFAAAHNFNLLGEVYVKKSYSGKVDRLEPRVGYRILTTEDLITTLGVGADFKNRKPEYRLLLSLTYLFSKEKKKIQKIYEMEE